MKKKLLFLLPFILAFLGSSNAQNALNFDGINDFVQTTSPGVLASNNRTFEAWVYISSTAPSANLTILDYGTNAVGSRNTFLIDASRSLRFISGGTNANLPASSSSIVAATWTHVAFVLDNGTGYTYINGVQSSTGNLSNVNTPSGNADITIGQRVSGGNIPFAGKIDELRVWDVARTPAEIMANMNSELCALPTSLVAYYKLNQGVATGNNAGLTNVIDETGNTATAMNFSMSGTSSNWDTGTTITAITPLNLTVSVDTANQVLTSMDTSSTISHQWYDCASNTVLSGDTNRTYAPRSGGSFAVILSNGICVDTSACYMISSTGGGGSNLQGKALHFDGTNDYVQSTYSGVLDSANRTFEAWINVSTSAASSNLCILDYGMNAVGSRNTFMVNGSRGVSFLSGGTNANMGTSAAVVTAGQWTHVAFVLDSGIGYIYINGVQSATGTLTSVNTPTGNTDLRIGERVSGGSIPFSGEIDEVRIWNVARSQAEIAANMNTIYCGAVSGLTAYYDMDNGIAGGNNSALTKVFNPINSGDGFLTNFALTGASSNFVGPGASLSSPTFDTTLTLSGLMLTANDSTSESYRWIDCSNGMIFSAETLRTFVAPSNGTYAVVLNKNGCVDTSDCTTIIGLRIDKNNVSDQYQIRPNPFAERFELINKTQAQINLLVRSIRGNIVIEKRKVNQERIEFHLAKLKSGVYFLTIEDETGETTNLKLIKK